MSKSSLLSKSSSSKSSLQSSSSSHTSSSSVSSKKAIVSLLTHPLLPLNKVNDDHFKILMCKLHLKKKLTSKYKTDISPIFTYSNSIYNHIQNSTPFSLPKLPSKIRHIYFTNNKHKYKFRLYNDPDIGISSKYDIMLPQNNKEEHNYDSDEDTDEEELELAYKKVIDMLSHSIEYKNPFRGQTRSKAACPPPAR